MKINVSLYSKCALVLTTALAVFITGCPAPIKKPPEETAMVRRSSFSYPDFGDDLELDGLEHSILKSLVYLQRVPADRTYQFGKDRFDAAHLIKSLQYFLDFIRTSPSRKELKKFIRSNYNVYQSVGRNQRGEVLFTGYYEPHLSGSLYRNEEYLYPIYALPTDLMKIDLSAFNEKYKGDSIIGRYTGQTVVPYYDRREIDGEDVLVGKAEPLVWVKDPVDVFFLQIQGSGKVFLNTGEVINVHYHGTNGRPYRSIGRLLIEEQKIPKEEMSMQKIRSYLQAHPEEMAPVLNHNPSYVFFKLEPEGPLGYLNVLLTPGRSVALDRRLFPPAALAYVQTKKPVVDSAGQIDSWADCSRFVLNQDTGGAIRGPGRADLFWGNGPYAEIAAGHLAHTGKLYFMILKPNIPK
ncbi:MAG: murein transglycosylase A [Desulfobacterales bacterium]|jgi:membrane-bound lytic murein transglycosylase A|nr:murein transglycosylase A [Desulfobacterales bacterium]MDH4009608.1 murein transglycosylase A [Desulfobacterales bacterium]